MGLDDKYLAKLYTGIKKESIATFLCHQSLTDETHFNLRTQMTCFIKAEKIHHKLDSSVCKKDEFGYYLGVRVD